MIPPPPLSTLFPYTTLFRSASSRFGSRSCSARASARSSRTEPGNRRRRSSPPSDDHDPVQLQGPHAAARGRRRTRLPRRSEEHTSELQSQSNLVCRLLLEKK